MKRISSDRKMEQVHHWQAAVSLSVLEKMQRALLSLHRRRRMILESIQTGQWAEVVFHHFNQFN